MKSRDLQGLTADLDGIGHVLRDLRLSVPAYQRSYSWESEEVQAFWEDLRAAVLSNDVSYFMGTIVLAGRPQSRDRIIIDGQQRLATASMLLAAIRDAFIEAGDQSRATVIQNDYLTQKTLKAASREARLELNTQDAEFFNNLVLGLTDKAIGDKVRFASNERIARAYELLKKNLGAEIDAAKNQWADRLLRWVEFLESGVQVIVVRVLNDADAFLVFETLNDRGLALTVADLLKNYIFGLARDDLPQVEEPWLSAASILDTPEGSQRFLDFLRQYWSSWHGATRERELYQSIRRHVRSESQAIDISEKFEQGSTLYLALATGDIDHWPSASIDVRTVESLHRLRLSQNRPLLIAAMEELEEEEWVHLVRGVVCWSVRGLIVGGIGGGTTERVYSDAAMRIRNGEAERIEEIFELLTEIIPSNEQFRLSFEGASVPRNYLARYYWLAFEAFANEEDGPAFVSVEAESDVVLHRVLPRSPDPSEWSEFDVSELGAYANRLGNTVIIERELLSKVDATNWNKLQEVAAESSFKSARSLAECNKWSPDTIADRQRHLADVAPDIWLKIAD